jgi:hypothetical protein
MAGNRSTSSRQRVFVSSGKPEGVPEITRENSNTGNIQKGRATF